MNVGLISLGCEKNLVDSEMILGTLSKDKVNIVTDLNKADTIIINTCGFIDTAKEESINTIMDALDYKKNGTKIIVTGCLVKRYKNELKELIPEVDMWVSLEDYDKIGELFNQYFKDKVCAYTNILMKRRVLSTPDYLAYVRISDGCNNRCAYCAIPGIRGNFKSISRAEILEEVERLAKSGTKEICLISQDLSNYGYDTGDSLANLLKEIVKIKGDYKIRLLYLYPDEITDEFIEVVRDNVKILPYFDVPFQHASSKILGWMNRKTTQDSATHLINKIKSQVPGAIIRTTMIVGFPHETDKDFNELIEFIKLMKFNHLGAFEYSREKDTTSYDMNHQVSKKIKKERYNKLMETQKEISLELNQQMVGQVYDCLIESYDDGMYNGRTYAFAPDDIDGAVYVRSDKDLNIGDVVKVKITEATYYDLFGITE